MERKNTESKMLVKKCNCGKVYKFSELNDVPSYLGASELKAYGDLLHFFNCTCGTTLVFKESDLRHVTNQNKK